MEDKSLLQHILSVLKQLIAFISESSKEDEPERVPERINQVHNKKHKYFWDILDYVEKGPNVNVKGSYSTSDGYPIGLIVHYTAGWNRPGKAISTLKNTKYGFWCLDITGKIYQPANMPLNKFGYHAGTSGWIIDGKKRTGVSKYFMGMEINCGGLLGKDNKTWFDKYVKSAFRRTVKKEANRYPGTYEIFSQEQEDSLFDFCIEMKKNNENFSFDYVLGHDEVAGPRGIGRHRKQDPGGSLSVTMDEFRAKLKKAWGETKEVKRPIEIVDRSDLKAKLKKNSKQLTDETIANFAHWATTDSRVKNKDHAILIDMKKKSSLKRFYVIDLKTGITIRRHKTAHGKNSDPNHDGYIDSYSNVSGSNKSSLGAMITGKHYGNKNPGGWSKFPWATKLHGLEKGINDNVYKRAIVFHSSSYVDDSNSNISGRSLGCPAVDDDVAKEIQQFLKEGTLFYIADDRFQ